MKADLVGVSKTVIKKGKKTVAKIKKSYDEKGFVYKALQYGKAAVKVGEGVDLSKYKKITDESSVDITVTNRGQTSTATYTGKDALFESASYSYYTLRETPKYYKEVTLNADGSLSFGKTQGTAQKVSGVTPELTTQTSYGDYQLNLDGLENTIFQSGTQVYGVIISTKEGNDYGMRHL